jgi:D-xylose transport system ATP-binding protein
VATHPTRELTTDKVISMMVGREVKNLYPRPTKAAGTSLLKVEGWSVEDPVNPGRQVLHNVDFEVRQGEVLGIGGLMGAGRTALVSSLFGAARSRVTGRLSVGGGAPRGPFKGPAEAIAAGLALVSEDRKRYGLVLEASIAENMTLATLEHFSRGVLLDHEAREAQVKTQFDALRIKAPGMFAIVNQLSGGNQQKVVLGKWLMSNPRVLFLDEPTRGIDVGAKSEIYQLIAALAERGLGVVLVSSDLPELLGMSHRVLVLSLGRATADLAADGASPETVMAAATMKV